ncbi:hypothetical protein LG290_03995 [Halomonas sediminis]
MVSFPKALIHPLTDIFHWCDWPKFCQVALRIFVLMVLLALGTLIVYATGGTRYAYSYLMLLPVLPVLCSMDVLCAPGGLGDRLSMAVMPLVVSSSVSQSTPVGW